MNYPQSREREGMDSFISELFNRRNKYLEKKFEKVNPNLNYEFQYAMFYHLHSLEIINSEKLDKLISELDKVFAVNIITFSEN